MKTPNCLRFMPFIGYKIAWCILIFCAINCQTAFAQGQKLYMAQEDVGQPVQDFLAQNSIQKVYVFGVAGESFAVINKDKLSADIKRKYPDASASGIGALDWEGKAFEKLKARGPITPDVQQAMNDYISVLQLAKTLRPNVKWGFYGIPFTTYYNRDAKWKQSCSNVMPLLQQCDVFFPSLYTFYQDDSKGSNEDYARDNLLESLSLAKELNKSVMPFVWHRYHDSNKTIGLQLIPSDEFKRYLNAVLSTSYKGTKVAGLVWWGSDQYYYNVKSPALVNEMNASGQTDFKTYHDNLIVKYGNVALDAIQGSR